MVTYTKKNVSFLAMIYDRSQELIYFCHSQAPELFRTNFDSATLCVKIISVIRVEFCWVSLNPSWWYVFWNIFFLLKEFFSLSKQKNENESAKQATYIVTLLSSMEFLSTNYDACEVVASFVHPSVRLRFLSTAYQVWIFETLCIIYTKKVSRNFHLNFDFITIYK